MLRRGVSLRKCFSRYGVFFFFLLLVLFAVRAYFQCNGVMQKCGFFEGRLTFHVRLPVNMFTTFYHASNVRMRSRLCILGICDFIYLSKTKIRLCILMGCLLRIVVDDICLYAYDTPHTCSTFSPFKPFLFLPW